MSTKQNEILDFIKQKIQNDGHSPSVREIAIAVNLKSTSSVQHHINNLIEKGYLDKRNRQSRSISSTEPISNLNFIPIIGQISAGTPLLAEENKIGEIPYPSEKYNKDLFALKVSGDSMIEAGIFDGDIVVVDKNKALKNGDIGAFMVYENEATVKYLDTILGSKYLIPANKNYENLLIDENVEPIGKVVSLFRDI
ncbi:MAG: transcriptional repressor LexA [Actinomycetota bacterium]|nr:transcriptional repressor LexA [Actinomycetota bacterium]MDA3013399.1 transcriptional repressor LexA [Actinomycetota bacterium]